MKDRIDRLAQLLKTAPRKNLLAFAAILIVAAAIPLTVIVSQRQQNLEQNAASGPCTSGNQTCDGDSPQTCVNGTWGNPGATCASKGAYSCHQNPTNPTKVGCYANTPCQGSCSTTSCTNGTATGTCSLGQFCCKPPPNPVPTPNPNICNPTNCVSPKFCDASGACQTPANATPTPVPPSGSTCTSAQQGSQYCTGNTSFKQCNLGVWTNFDCAIKVGANTVCQTASNINGTIPNASCVYTCATAAAVASGERCINPADFNSATYSYSGDVCDPGRICVKINSSVTTCQTGVNSDGCTPGKTQCGANKAAVQTCTSIAVNATLSCSVWKNTATCSQGCTVSSAGVASCAGSTTVCTEGEKDCLSQQPRICHNNAWQSNGSICTSPKICNNSTGTCEVPVTPPPSTTPITCTQCAAGSCSNINCGGKGTCIPTTIPGGGTCNSPKTGISCTGTPTQCAGSLVCDPTTNTCVAPSASPSTSPSASPSTSPSPTASPGTTYLALNIGLDEIGAFGDNYHPSPINSEGTYGSNENPNTKTRQVTVTLENPSNNSIVVKAINGTVNYNAPTGTFQNPLFPLPSSVTSGTYRVIVKSPGYLSRPLPGTVTIRAGATNPQGLPAVGLTAGDFNNDDTLDILDYNLFNDCFIYTKDQSACTASLKQMTDITDNGGNPDYDDYNAFGREWFSQHGSLFGQ